jgi:hypothetical protein
MNHPHIAAVNRELALGWLDAWARLHRGLWGSWHTLAAFGLDQSGRWAARVAGGPGGEGVFPSLDPATVPATAPPARPAGSSDDLARIHGIGPALEKRLRQAGVRTYAEIAAWPEATLDDIERRLMGGVCMGRIRRDDWVGQARRLLKGKG